MLWAESGVQEMAITTLDNGWISDSFEIGSEPLVLKDAIVMPAEQYNQLTAEQIAAMKQQRYDNWMAVITAPPAAGDPAAADTAAPDASNI
jgi:hypothetical protein